MRRPTLCAALLVGVLCFFPAHAKGPDSDLARRLERQRMSLRQVEADLASAEADAQRIRARERGVAERLVDAANRVGLIGHALTKLVRAESLLTRDIAETRVRRSLVQTEIAEREKVMERRVRVLYTEGRRQPYQRALLASSLSHWLAARYYLVTLNRRDLIDVRHLRSDRARLDSLAALQGEQQETLDSLIARKAEERTALVAAREQARRLLKRVRRSRRLVERAAAELAAQRAESEAKIAEYLRAQEQAGAQAEEHLLVGGVSAAAPVDFSEEKGHLPWPVNGRVIGTFGRSRDNATRTWTRNRGIDIKASKGTEVLAVASGEVVMIDWFRGYGSFVILSHGQNYYTLYAHLSTVTVRRNDRVRQGEIIGISGDSGTLSEAKVHFELLAGHKALNPLEWLAPHGNDSS